MDTAVHPLATIVAASRSPYALGEYLDAAPSPVLVVDVTAQNVPTDLGTILAALPAVTIAISDNPSSTTGGGLDAFDLVLSDRNTGPEGPGGVDRRWTTPDDGVAATVDRIGRQARIHPQASVAAVQLLRMSERLGVADGLAAESFAYSTLQSGREFRRWLGGRPAPSPVTDDPDPLAVERSGPELRISFNRPHVRNAFGFEVRDALIEALQLAAADDRIRAIVLRGPGPAFCSGGDLREFGTLADPATGHLIRTTRSAAWWMHRLSDRIRVELHGACFGAGIELAAFARQVHAAADTIIALPEVSFGLVPGAGGTVSLPRRIGRHRSAYLILSGKRLGPSTARAWGLVDTTE